MNKEKGTVRSRFGPSGREKLRVKLQRTFDILHKREHLVCVAVGLSVQRLVY